jgi:hypothetical protein
MVMRSLIIIYRNMILQYYFGNLLDVNRLYLKNHAAFIAH